MKIGWKIMNFHISKTKVIEIKQRKNEIFFNYKIYLFFKIIDFNIFFLIPNKFFLSCQWKILFLIKEVILIFDPIEKKYFWVFFLKENLKRQIYYAKDGCKIKFQTQEEELCMRYCEQIFNIINISPQNTVQKCMKQTYLYLAYL